MRMRPVLRALSVATALALAAPAAASAAPLPALQPGPPDAPVIEAGGFHFKFGGHHGFRHPHFGGLRRHGFHPRGHFLHHPKRFPHVFHHPKRFRGHGFHHPGFRHKRFRRHGFGHHGHRRPGVFIFIPGVGLVIR